MLTVVEAHLVSALGADSVRAQVSFLGADPIDVLRFSTDDGLVSYVTVGTSRAPVSAPDAEVVAQHGPRVELVLTLRGGRDSVLRPLAALAASPVVEGVVLGVGASVDVSEPLWEGSRFTAVLVAESGGLVPDLDLGGEDVVRFHAVLPMTPNEAAWKRVHGGGALEERWMAQGIDLRDPERPSADLS